MSAVRSVAIIENNAAARAQLRQAVENADFRVHCFIGAAAALVKVRDGGFSMVIFGLDGDDGDPIAMCQVLSRVSPVITVTSHHDPERCARALEHGADDCVVRPLSARELIARMRNVLRRVNSGGHNDDALSCSLREMQLWSLVSKHDLTRGEAELLAVLAGTRSPLALVQLAQILDAKAGTVKSQIQGLRRKLGRGRIVNRVRLGYDLMTD